jgi:CRISPR system Cascade subunit CasA
VLIGSDTNRWNATIMNAVKDTKTAIYVLKKFASSICNIRNTNADITSVVEREAYFAVDEPFKRWLSEIHMDTDKNEHSKHLRQQIFNILKQKAQSIIYPLTNRDLKGIDKDNEINTSVNEYSKTVGELRSILIDQGGFK